MDRELMLINGEWVGSEEDRFLLIETPGHRGRVIAEVPRAKAPDVDRAVWAALQAFEGWRKVSPLERGRRMIKIVTGL